MTEKFIRYVKTATLRKVIDPLLDEIILGLEARRSMQEDVALVEPGPGWIHGKRRGSISLEVDYCSLIHGPFHREILLDTVDDLDLTDMTMTSLDVLIPDATRIGDRLAAVTGDETLREKQFVAKFTHWPTAKEGERRHLLLPKVDEFWDYEGQLGLHKTVLDLDNILWLQSWREVTRGRIGTDYRREIEKWKRWFTSIKGRDLRKVVQEIWPRDMVDSRQYVWGEEEGWQLSATGTW